MNAYEATPLWNQTLPLEERLDYLIKEMTPEEKLQCLTTSCPDIPRLGIQAFSMGGEAAHGIEARHDQDFNRGEPDLTTSLPQPIGMSASFDKELITECGRVVGEEARALHQKNPHGGLCRWAPTVDMERDPRWGRNEEAYGEDPFLTGEMASGYIQGMRGDHPFYLRCGATLKHFYANNVEKNRDVASSSIDGRNKYEYYLEPFRKAVTEGKAEAIMTAYNEINGIPAIVNDEVQKIAKDLWGLPGHVVCDGHDMQQTVLNHNYFATHAETIAYALKAGIDSFPDDRELLLSAGREALEKGLMTEAELNRSVRNTFRTRIRLGLYDKTGECPYRNIGEEALGNKEHHEIGLAMAKASVVLLKNEKELLPIAPQPASSLAVVGPLHNVWYKDWYCGIPPYQVTPLEGLRAEYPDAAICTGDGLTDIQLRSGDKSVGLDENGWLCLVESAQAETFTMNDWGSGSVTLQAGSNGLLAATAEDPEKRLRAASKEAFGWFVRECFSLEKTEKDAFRLLSWDKKPVGIDPQGYLCILSEDAMPPVFTATVIRDGIAEAAALAAKSDYAVVVLGSNPVINSKETLDRDTLDLPPVQQELALRICESNPHTVIVFVSNYPYALHGLKDKAPALLLSASGSQDLGHAIAQILSGRAVPAGRLPMTWYQSDADLPDINDYDIIKGKRTYQYFDREVLYPFGHGLSYTRFEYSGLAIALKQANTINVDSLPTALSESTLNPPVNPADALNPWASTIENSCGSQSNTTANTNNPWAASANCPADAWAEITLTVENTGSRTGDEVVQIYVRKENSRVARPLKQLKAFTRIKNIASGEKRAVTLQIPLTELRYYDVISRRMLFETGEYCFMAGASSKDIKAQATLTLSGEEAPARNPFAYTLAEQYDDYKNIYLHKGPNGNTAITAPAEDSAPTARATYRDFRFTKAPATIKFDLHPQTAGTITVYAEGRQIAQLPLEPAPEFTEREVPLTATGFTEKDTALPPIKFPVPLCQNIVLELQICGKIKLSGFSFT